MTVVAGMTGLVGLEGGGKHKMITYRTAEIHDTDLVFEYIKKLAVYEKLAHEVTAMEGDIRQSLFGDNPKAFCVIAEYNGRPAGFALCFYNFSTFQGRPGIYIEDLYVDEEFRGHGIGKGFFKYLAQKALSENCGRIQWAVLDWNEPSIEFYKSMGGKPMDDWIIYRLEGAAIHHLAHGTTEKKVA
jgi:GNAT superfamily N-acetyltransferase